MDTESISLPDDSKQTHTHTQGNRSEWWHCWLPRVPLFLLLPPSSILSAPAIASLSTPASFFPPISLSLPYSPYSQNIVFVFAAKRAILHPDAWLFLHLFVTEAIGKQKCPFTASGKPEPFLSTRMFTHTDPVTGISYVVCYHQSPCSVIFTGGLSDLLAHKASNTEEESASIHLTMSIHYPCVYMHWSSQSC